MRYIVPDLCSPTCRTYIIEGIFAPSNPSELITDVEVTFYGDRYPIASSLNNGIGYATLNWDFDGDGVYDDQTRIFEYPTHTYTKAGKYWVTIEGKDFSGNPIKFKSLVDIKPKNRHPPNSPILISPGSNSEPGSDVFTTTPTFFWESVADADHYGLYISKYPYGLSNIVYTNENLKGTSHTLPNNKALSDGIKYRWDMTAFNSDGLQSDHSPNKYFTVDINNPPVNYPPVVAVISPNGGENIAAGNPYQIKWLITDNTGIIQAVNIYGSLNGGISWFTIASGETDDGAYTWTPSNTSAQFRIKVEAEDSLGAKGNDMSNGNFSVVSNCSAPSLPTLQNISVSADSYFVNWSPSSNVNYYNLQEDTSASFSNPTVVYSSSGTSWHSGIKSPDTYYYRVEAINHCNSSGWSNIKSATIQATNQGPGPITALNPADDDVNQPLNLTLSWSASHPSGEGLRYNVYVVYADTEFFYPNNIKSYGQTATTYSLNNLSYNPGFRKYSEDFLK